MDLNLNRINGEYIDHNDGYLQFLFGWDPWAPAPNTLAPSARDNGARVFFFLGNTMHMLTCT
jgi:hypothetical protein